MFTTPTTGFHWWGEIGINAFHVHNHHCTLCWERNFSLQFISDILRLFSSPVSSVNVREACHQSFWYMHCISLSLQLSRRCNTQIMWCKFLFHFTTLVNMNSLKHRQTFKNHPLIAGLLRRQVEHAASARRHAMLLLWLTALPASWISCLLSKGKTFSESPGSAGCCTLSELVGVLQPKPMLQPQQPVWQEHILSKFFICWIWAGREGEGRSEWELGSILTIVICQSLIFNFLFLKGWEWKGSQKHASLPLFEAGSPGSQANSVTGFASSTGSPQLNLCSFTML